MVKLEGSGRTEVTAAGVADAESRLEKELRGLLPAAALDVREIRRLEGPGRLVEGFLISYRVSLETSADAPTPGAAARIVLAETRGRVRDSLFARVNWEKPRTVPGGAGD